MPVGPSDLILQWDVKRLTPRMAERLMQHAEGKPMPFIMRGNDRLPTTALIKRNMLRFVDQEKMTEPTPYGKRAIAVMVAGAMRVDVAVIEPAEREREVA